jgi:hypothetical protein
VVLIEVQENITLVFQRAMRATLGLGIGSPLSAGAAIMTASWVETVHFRGLSAMAKSELLTRVLLRRWLDDLLLIAAKSVSTELRDFLTKHKGRFFYGPTLDLKPVRDPEPFGFALAVTDQGVMLRNKQGYVGERGQNPDGGWQARRSPFHGGPQFQGERVASAVVVGHLYRLIDHSMQTEPELILSLQRLAIEMLDAGLGAKRLGSALKRVQPTCSFSLRPLRNILSWPAPRRRAFCDLHGAIESALRSEARAAMCTSEFEALAAL